MSNIEWLTFALVIITGFYAWFTFRISSRKRSSCECNGGPDRSALRPYVVVAVIPRIGTTLLLLEIQNTGRSPAMNLRLKMDRDFYPHAERREHDNIAKLPAFTEPIESLAPGVRMQFILGVGGTICAPGIDEALCPKVFSVKARYHFAEHTYEENNTIDLRPILHSAAIYDPVAEEIRRLRESLEKLLKMVRPDA